MMHDRPRRLPAAVLLIVPALAFAACAPAAGKSSPSARPAAPAASNGNAPTAAPSRPPVIPDRANALIAVGRQGATDLEVLEATSGHSFMTLPVGAPDPTWGHLLSTSRDGPATIVRNQVLEDTGSNRELRLDGDWRLPAIGQDPIPGGRSADGSTFVLVEPRTDPYGTASTSRFAVIRAPTPPSVAPIELARIIELPGAFEFDTLSANGSILYVIQHLDDQAGGAYQVRSVDVSTGRLDDVPVANKSNVDETMAGRPITQLRQADGMVYTLYRGTEHPFIHALSSTDKWAICIDLPATGQDDASAADDWALTGSTSGPSVYAVNATLGLVAEIDPSKMSIRRQATLPATTGAAAPRIVLVKFGHEPGGPLGRRAAMTASGETILAGGRDGLTAIATKDLSVAWRALPGESVRGVGLRTDGATAYVLTGSGRLVAISMADGSLFGDVPDGGFDRLVAILGG